VKARDESWEKGEKRLGVKGTDWAVAFEGTGTSWATGAGGADLEVESGKMKVVNARC